MKETLELAVNQMEDGRIEIILPIEIADKTIIRFANIDEIKMEKEILESKFDDIEEDEECDCEYCSDKNCPEHPEYNDYNNSSNEEENNDKLEELYHMALQSTESITKEEYEEMNKIYNYFKVLEEITGIKSDKLYMLRNVLDRAKELLEEPKKERKTLVIEDNRRPNGISSTRVINGKRTTGMIDRLF